MRRCSLVLLAVGLLVAASCGEKKPVRKPGADKQAIDVKKLKGEIRTSIEKAAAFLRRVQHENGSWGGHGGGVGKTGLVIEALAGAPEDVRKKCGGAIEKGLKYILANRRPDGSIVDEDGMVVNYRTSIATRALIAIDAKKYKDAIDAAVKYTKGIQVNDPKNKLRHGSIGYGSNKDMGDQMNMQEAIEMLRKAGVSPDDPVFKRSLEFLFRTQALDEGADPGVRTANDGGAIYRSDHTVEGASKAGMMKLPDGTMVPRPYGGATYALLKSLLFAGLKKDHPRVVAAYDWIRRHYSVTENPGLGEKGLYYYYYTMARTLELWGSPTIKVGNIDRNWAAELAARVISLQDKGGKANDGSWFGDAKWMEDDHALATAYSVYVLNTCRRMLEK